VRRWYACMLIERNAPGDKEKARELLNEAIAMYREIGYGTVARMPSKAKILEVNESFVLTLVLRDAFIG